MSFESEGTIQGDLEVYSDPNFMNKTTGIVPVGTQLFIEQTDDYNGKNLPKRVFI